MPDQPTKTRYVRILIDDGVRAHQAASRDIDVDRAEPEIMTDLAALLRTAATNVEVERDEQFPPADPPAPAAELTPEQQHAERIIREHGKAVPFAEVVRSLEGITGWNDLTGEQQARMVAEVDRLIGLATVTATWEQADRLIDPDCRGGKHTSCVGGPRECDCHTQDGEQAGGER